MKVGIIIAFEREYNQMRQLLGGDQGHINGNRIVLRQSGIGKVNAALGTQKLIDEHHPDCIINTGVAGGIDSSLRVMHLVAARELVYHDVWCGDDNALGQVQGLPERFPSNEALYHTALSLQNEIPIRGGLICTGDQFITADERLRQIKHDFPEALAVDMESCAIAHTCYLNQTPFLALRIISDVPAEAKNQQEHVEQYNDFWATMGNKSFQAIRTYLQHLPDSIAQ